MDESVWGFCGWLREKHYAWLARGPGDFLGKRQSGRDAFSALRNARLPQDKALLEAARGAAAEIIADWQDGRPPPPALLAAMREQAAAAKLDVAQLPMQSVAASVG
jgi:hypothetical protein